MYIYRTLVIYRLTVVNKFLNSIKCTPNSIKKKQFRFYFLEMIDQSFQIINNRKHTRSFTEQTPFSHCLLRKHL